MAIQPLSLSLFLLLSARSRRGSYTEADSRARRVCASSSTRSCLVRGGSTQCSRIMRLVEGVSGGDAPDTTADKVPTPPPTSTVLLLFGFQIQLRNRNASRTSLGLGIRIISSIILRFEKVFPSTHPLYPTRRTGFLRFSSEYSRKRKLRNCLKSKNIIGG